MNSPQNHQEDDTAFINGHLEPTADFDWDSVDPECHATVEAEMRRQCAIALAKFCKRLLEVGGRNRNQFFIAANCFAFAAHIHPDQGKSMEEIAHSVGLKSSKAKAAFGKRVNQIRDILKLPRIAGARSLEARKKFKKLTTQRHEQRKRQITHNKPTGNFLDRVNGAH